MFIVIVVWLSVIDKFTVNILDDIKNKRQNLERTEKKIIKGDLIEGTSLLTNYINSRGFYKYLYGTLYLEQNRLEFCF